MSFEPKSWKKNPLVFIHKKENEIIFMADIDEEHYLKGNEDFLRFWNALPSCISHSSLKGFEYFELMKDYNLILESNDSGAAVKLTTGPLTLDKIPFPEHGEYQVFAMGPGWDSSDY